MAGNGQQREVIRITFPDGSERTFPKGITGRELAEQISPRLAREALAIEVNGEVRDLTRPIEEDARVRILTWEDPEGKAVYWHSTAHLMAEALEALYPGVKFGIGPPIEQGFYYDVDLGGRKLSAEDLARIEEKNAGAGPPRRALRAHSGLQTGSPGVLQKERRSLQGRVDRRTRRRHDHLLPPGQLHRPVPRAACAFDGLHQAREAAQRRRRLLARRRTPAPAHPHLRHQLPQEKKNSTNTCTGSKKPASETIAGWAASWSCSPSARRWGRACRSGYPAEPRCARR